MHNRFFRSVFVPLASMLLLWTAAVPAAEIPGVPAAGDTSRLITGRVVDGAGRPIVSASVGIVVTQEIARRVPDLNEKPLFVTTDREGRYSLALPPQLSAVTVVAAARGFARTYSDPVTLRRGGVATTLRMPAGVAIKGNVRDDNLIPVARAEVRLLQLAVPADTLPASTRALQAASGSRGEFSLPGVTPARYDIGVRASGYAHKWVRGRNITGTPANRPIEIVLTRGMYILGTVTESSGKGIAAVRIAARAGQDERIEAASDASGAFKIGPFANGQSVELTARANGYGAWRSDDVVAPSESVAIILDRNGLLRGRVTDADSGEPMREFRVSFHRKETVPLRTAKFPGERSFTSADGSFEWPDISPGVWTLSISAPGYQRTSVSGVVVAETGGEEIGIVLRKGATLRGRIVNEATSLPIEGAAVVFDDELLPPGKAFAAAPRVTTYSNEHGQFQLDGLSTVRGVLVVSRAGFATARTDVLPGSGSDLEVRLDSGYAVEGQVLSADGSRALAAMVNVYNKVSGVGGGVPTRVDGAFDVSGLSPGAYLISAEANEGRTEEVDLNLTGPQKLIHLTLKVQPGATVSGAIVGLMPGESGRTTLLFANENGYVWQSGSDGDDRYSLSGLPEGPASITAETSLDRSITTKINVTGKSNVVNFEFPAGVRLSGRITRGGVPARFAKLNAIAMSGQALSASSETSQSGEYTFAGLSPGKYRIEVAGGVRTAEITLSMADAQLDFELPELKVSGQIVDARSGEPLANAEVVMRSMQRATPSITAKSDYRGEFTLTGYDPGDFELSYYKTGYDLLIRQQPLATSMALPAVALQPGAGYPVIVRDGGTDQPLGHVFVQASSPSGGAQQLQVSLDGKGAGTLPAGLEGSKLSFWWFGYQVSTLTDWNAMPLVVNLVKERH